MLVKHTYQEHWCLAGGGVKKAKRLNKQLGAHIENIKLFGAYDNFYEYKNDYIVIFTCNNFTLTGEDNNEIEAFEYFDI